jgi:hypothetical protein
MLDTWTIHDIVHGQYIIHCVGHVSLEESLSITTGRCDLAIATHARKMHKNLFVVVHPEVLDND